MANAARLVPNGPAAASDRPRWHPLGGIGLQARPRRPSCSSFSRRRRRTASSASCCAGTSSGHAPSRARSARRSKSRPSSGRRFHSSRRRRPRPRRRPRQRSPSWPATSASLRRAHAPTTGYRGQRNCSRAWRPWRRRCPTPHQRPARRSVAISAWERRPVSTCATTHPTFHSPVSTAPLRISVFTAPLHG